MSDWPSSCMAEFLQREAVVARALMLKKYESSSLSVAPKALFGRMWGLPYFNLVVAAPYVMGLPYSILIVAMSLRWKFELHWVRGCDKEGYQSHRWLDICLLRYVYGIQGAWPFKKAICP